MNQDRKLKLLALASALADLGISPQDMLEVLQTKVSEPKAPCPPFSFAEEQKRMLEEQRFIEQREKEAQAELTAANADDASGGIPLAAADGPPCPICGAITHRTGSCFRCLNCGQTDGCE